MTLNINNLGKVWKALHGARSKAHHIGMMLDVPVGTLNSIMKQYSDPLDQLRETLRAWLEMAELQKWQTIVEMLRSSIIGEPTLASDIKAEYCQGTPGQASGQAMPRDSQIQALQQHTELQQQLESKTHTIEQQCAIKGLQSMNQSATRPQPSPPQQETKHRELIWRDGPKAPVGMCIGSAVTDGTMVYCNGYLSVTVHLYHSDAQRWSTMPNLPNVYSTLVMIGRKLISVGGSDDLYQGEPTNSLLSLTRGRWLQHFPPMSTKRHSTAAICLDHYLIVAGGHDGHNELATVEVLSMDTLGWSNASSLPHPSSGATTSICGERLYLLGGWDQTGNETRSVLTATIPELLDSCQTLRQSTIWRPVTDAPYKLSSCATLCGQLVAVGGINEAKKATTAIFVYNESTDSWLPMGAMTQPRCGALVVSLHDNTMLVVGGWQPDKDVDTVEIANWTAIA